MTVTQTVGHRTSGCQRIRFKRNAFTLTQRSPEVITHGGISMQLQQSWNFPIVSKVLSAKGPIRLNCSQPVKKQRFHLYTVSVSCFRFTLPTCLPAVDLYVHIRPKLAQMAAKTTPYTTHRKIKVCKQASIKRFCPLHILLHRTALAMAKHSCM